MEEDRPLLTLYTCSWAAGYHLIRIGAMLEHQPDHLQHVHIPLTDGI